MLLSTGFSAVADGGLTATVLVYRVAGLVLHVATTILVFLAVRAHRPADATWAALFYGLNPLVLIESVGSAHSDVLVGMCLALALWSVANRRPALAGVALGAAVMTKAPVAVVLAPMLAALVGREPQVAGRLRVVGVAGGAALVTAQGAGGTTRAVSALSWAPSIMRAPAVPVLVTALWAAALAWPQAQSSNMFQASMEHPAIGYSTRPSRDSVARLQEQLARGERRLAFDGPSGYLASLLAALDVPVSSQMLVFSENSLQRAHISQKTPRAIYFNDTVSVGWALGAGTIEVAALDATQGVHFYSLAQTAHEQRFVPRRECLQCHLTSETLGVPGLFTSSVLPLSDNRNDYVEGWPVDHRTPIEDRWGGWFVTGVAVPVKHLGNVPVLHVPRSYVRAPVAPRLETVATAVDAAPYMSPHSDIVALLVFNHQAHATNLLVRLGWEARVAEADFPGVPPSMWPERVRRAARDAADYLLFLNEAPLPAPVAGGAAFADTFASAAANDPRLRPLRALDLSTRLFRVSCSYMIGSEVFEALPAGARRLVYERMWEVLSGGAHDRLSARLSAGDRRVVLDLLRTIKTDLPGAFPAGVGR